jgi:hypothetical protein
MEPPQTVELVGNQQLVVETTSTGNLLHVLGSDGFVRLSLHITPDGPVLRFEGAGIMIQSSGALAIDAETVIIQGRTGLTLLSGGDAEILAVGDLSSKARIQNVTATLATSISRPTMMSK